MDFDLTFTHTLPDGTPLEYGLIAGSGAVAFIKSGKGGDHRGHDDKHLRMARRIHVRYGYTVICSPNPVEQATYTADKAVLDDYIARYGAGETEVCLIGNSNGAYQNLLLAGMIPPPRKMIGINMPLMLNFHKSTAMLQSLGETEKIMVYGDKDPSFRYLPMLEFKSIERLRVLRLQGIDHLFSGRIQDFAALGDLL
jgi:hypothetical protein